MKKYNIKINIPFNDKLFIFFAKVPIINTFLKNKESRIEDILNDYIGDFMSYCYNTSGLNFNDNVDLLEYIHKKILKINKNFTYDNLVDKIEENLEYERKYFE